MTLMILMNYSKRYISIIKYHYFTFDNKCIENKYKIKIFEKIINNCCIIKRDIARLLFGVKIEYPTPL